MIRYDRRANRRPALVAIALWMSVGASGTALSGASPQPRLDFGFAGSYPILIEIAGGRVYGHVVVVDQPLVRKLVIANQGEVPLDLAGGLLDAIRVVALRGFKRVPLPWYQERHARHPEVLGAISQELSEREVKDAIEFRDAPEERWLRQGQSLEREVVVRLPGPGDYLLYAWIEPGDTALVPNHVARERRHGKLSEPVFIRVRERLLPSEAAETAFWTARRLFVEGDFAAGLREIDKALEHGADSATLLGERGFALEAIGDIEAAKAAYQQCLDKHASKVAEDPLGGYLQYESVIAQYGERLAALERGKPLGRWVTAHH